MLGGGEFGSRLNARIRQKDGLSYGVGAGLDVSAFEPSGSLQFYAIYAPQNRAKVQAGFDEELARFVKDGITPAELVEAKQAILAERVTARASDASLASNWMFKLDQGRTFAWSVKADAKLAALTARPGQRRDPQVDRAGQHQLVRSPAPSTTRNKWTTTFLRCLPAEPGRYRHYKGGEYELVGVARHSETLEPLVIYRPLYNAIPACGPGRTRCSSASSRSTGGCSGASPRSEQAAGRAGRLQGGVAAPADRAVATSIHVRKSTVGRLRVPAAAPVPICLRLSSLPREAR